MKNFRPLLGNDVRRCRASAIFRIRNWVHFALKPADDLRAPWHPQHRISAFQIAKSCDVTIVERGIESEGVVLGTARFAVSMAGPEHTWVIAARLGIPQRLATVP